MRIIKEIFARIWALWGLISFAATFFIIFIPSMISYLIPGRAGQVYFIWISRIWMYMWLPLIGCPVRITGREHFINKGACVVLFNHNAFLDVPLSAPFVPGANKTIAKASFAKIPLFGWFYSRGSVLVDRKNEKSRSKSFDNMKAVLEQNMHMCIYPEGTRNRTSEPLKSFYDGAFRLAVAANKNIIPCVISGTRKAMPIYKTFYLLPTRLRMHFMEAVEPGNGNVEELKAKVFKQMYDYYVAQNPEYQKL